VRRQLGRIEQRFRLVQQRMRKSQMRGDIERFHATGQLPISEPALSFALLMQAFQRMADTSVGGGGDFERAEQDYRAALIRWNNQERGIEWM